MATYGTCDSLSANQPLNIPGTSYQAILVLPLRLLLVLTIWILTYPLFLIAGLLRALYLRIVRGRPSEILKYGTYNGWYKEGLHYANQQLYKEPLDEPRLKKVLIELCAEGGIEEKDVFLKFWDEQPNDWPPTGSYSSDYFIESNKRPNDKRHWSNFIGERAQRGEPPAYVAIHVFNGTPPQKPTVMWYAGSLSKWDGSSNFNFCKELMNRYIGNPPKRVFLTPEITPRSAELFDQGWFSIFLLKMPFVVGANWFHVLWCGVRAAKWAGGNGFGAKKAIMNFNKEDSARLYAGCQKLGIRPFAAFTYAAVKACKDILKEQPTGITQQSSLQTRHYPLIGQTHRDLVGDWLFGPMQAVPAEYGMKEAMDGYQELQKELDDIGPIMREAIMAKAYGLLNSGAAFFQAPPTYNVYPHALNRVLFMNNYGIRTMPEGSPFHTWNWNAPLWFGLNTINVDGATTTAVGSMFWGVEVVEAMRDNIEATLRDIMAKSDSNLPNIPTYKPPLINDGSP